MNYISKRAEEAAKHQVKKDLVEVIKIYSVDGNDVRKIEVDWTTGGHYYRYPSFTPEDEIWVEKVANKEDLIESMIHELCERAEMKYLGYGYGPAHDAANILEAHLRAHDPREMAGEQVHEPTTEEIKHEIEEDEAKTSSVQLAGISKRAALERSSLGIGISTTARLYWRKYYSQHNTPNMALLPNAQLNTIMGSDFKNAKPLHRFKLKDGSKAEIRKSHDFFYLAKISSGTYDILTIQAAYKEATPEISQRRLTPGWLETK